MDAQRRHGCSKSSGSIIGANPLPERPSTTNAAHTIRTSVSHTSSLTATSSSSRTDPHCSSSNTDDDEVPVSNDIWPGSESDDSNDDADVGAASSVRRGSTKGSGFFRNLVQKISKPYYKRYGFVPNTEQELDRNAQQNRKSAVLGIDLVPVEPPYLVSNCHFQVRDATEDWDLNTTFDFVHTRMLGDVPEKERLVQAIYDNLNPGGWAEFSLKELGSSLYYPTQYKHLLRKVGFENITETKNGVPTNACYPGRKLRKMGNMMAQNWIAILEPLTTPVMTNGLGWPPEDVKTLLTSVKKEIPDTRYHSYMTLLTVYCQKPRPGTASTTTSSLRDVIIPESPKSDS